MKKCSKELAERLVNMMMTNCSMTQFEHKQYKFDIKFKCSDYDEINHKRDYMFDFVFNINDNNEQSLFNENNKERMFKFYFTLNDLWDIDDITTNECISNIALSLDPMWSTLDKIIYKNKKKNKTK